MFPHLSVQQNLVYGRWLRPRGQRRASVEAIVDLLGLAALLDRPPASLSGGEKQRVAIGRALLAEPRLLLMDEPLAALDQARKAEILPYVARLRDEWKIPIVYVSHSVAEVAQLATTVVVLSQGRVVATGSAAEVLARAGQTDADGDAGSVLDAQVIDHDHEWALTRLHTAAGELWLSQLDRAPGTRLRVFIRATDVMLALERPQGLSAQNILPARVLALHEDGPSAVQVQLALSAEQGTDRPPTLLARLTRRAAAALQLRPGIELYAVIKSVAIDRSGKPD